MPDAIAALRDQALDMRVLRWSDGPKGATVTLDLHPDDVAKNGGVNPFKGREGKRAKVVIWWVADDETTEPAPTAPPPPSPSRSEQAKGARRNMTDMQRAPGDAAMLLDDPQYRRWLTRLAGIYAVQMIDRDLAEDVQRDVLGIGSKAELGKNDAAYERWIAHKDAFERHPIVNRQPQIR